MLSTVAFDADDTLWQNEHYYKLSQDRFAELLSDRADHERVTGSLFEAEKRNVGRYGFGIKGFTLSMIETAFLSLAVATLMPQRSRGSSNWAMSRCRTRSTSCCTRWRRSLCSRGATRCCL